MGRAMKVYYGDKEIEIGKAVREISAVFSRIGETFSLARNRQRPSVDEPLSAAVEVGRKEGVRGMLWQGTLPTELENAQRAKRVPKQPQPRNWRVRTTGADEPLPKNEINSPLVTQDYPNDPE